MQKKKHSAEELVPEKHDTGSPKHAHNYTIKYATMLSSSLLKAIKT